MAKIQDCYSHQIFLLRTFCDHTFCFDTQNRIIPFKQYFCILPFSKLRENFSNQKAFLCVNFESRVWILTAVGHNPWNALTCFYWIEYMRVSFRGGIKWISFPYGITRTTLSLTPTTKLIISYWESLRPLEYLGIKCGQTKQIYFLTLPFFASIY